MTRELLDAGARITATVCAAVAITGGVLALIGWALGLEVLTSIVPGFVTIKPNSALAFILAGLGLAGLRAGVKGASRHWGAASAALLLSLGLLTLFQMYLDTSIGIDEWLFPDRANAHLTPVPGRMAPLSAVGFVIIGISLLSIYFRKVGFSEFCAVLVFLVALLALVGYAYGIDSFYSVTGHTAMSLPTAILMLATSIGVLLAHPQTGVSRLLVSPSPVGQHSRQMLVIMCVVTLFSGAAIRELVGAYGDDMAFALFAMLMFVLIVATILFFGSRLVHAEQAILLDREALLESEGRFRGTFNNAFVGIAHVELDGHWAEVNDTLARLLGFSPEELRESTVEDLTYPADRAAHRELVQQLLTGQLDQYRLEKRYVTKAGKIVWVDLQAAPLVGADGEMRFIIKTILDITERKALEERLRNLAAVVENTLDFVAIYDLSLRPTYINAAGQRMLGLDPPKDGKYPNGLTFFVPDDVPFIESTALPALREKGAWTGEVRFQNLKTGEIIPSLWNAVAICDARGKAVAYTTVSPDLTDLKKVEAQLRETAEQLTRASREKDTFLSFLGHELRNPLAALRNALAVLHEQPEQEEVEEMRAIMSRQTAQIAALVDDLVDLARIQSGRLAVHTRPRDLTPIVRSVVKDRQIEAKTLGVEIELHFDDRTIPVAIDIIRIRQVLHNLLTNAFRAAPHGHVVVSLDVVDGEVRISIRDNGRGIAAEDIERIFKPFEQHRDTKRQGLGLGLPIAQELVSRHGGTLTAHSDGEGEGANFVVTLPISEAGLEAVGASAPPAEPASRRVVLIDDSRDSVDGLAALLSLKGHEVQVAYTGQQGVELVKSTSPDIVVTDIGLPDIDGYEVARQLRSMWNKEDFLLVGLTGFTDEKSISAAKQAGFDVYLTKPVNISRLLQVLTTPRPQDEDRKAV